MVERTDPAYIRDMPKPKPSKCIVPGCKTVRQESQQREMFLVPQSMRSEWLAAIPNLSQETKSFQTLYVCTRHFRDNDFQSMVTYGKCMIVNRYVRLKSNVIPSIFIPEEIVPVEENRWTTETEIEMIDYFDKHPVLWKTGCLTQTQQFDKQKLLKQLSQKLFHKVTVDEISNQFQTFRNKFLANETTWIHFKRMQFINKYKAKNKEDVVDDTLSPQEAILKMDEDQLRYECIKIIIPSNENMLSLTPSSEKFGEHVQEKLHLMNALVRLLAMEDIEKILAKYNTENKMINQIENGLHFTSLLYGSVEKFAKFDKHIQEHLHSMDALAGGLAMTDIEEVLGKYTAENLNLNNLNPANGGNNVTFLITTDEYNKELLYGDPLG